MANKRQIGVVLHIDETLAEERRRDILDGLHKQHGIEQARFTPDRPHLMVIDYHADKIGSQDVLGYIRREHVHAELVGPI